MCARFAGGSTIAVSISPIMRALRSRGVALSRSHMPVPPSTSGSGGGAAAVGAPPVATTVGSTVGSWR